MSNKIAVKDLSVAFDQGPVLDAISFDLMAGEIGYLMGPSGGGKTTLLRTIIGFERPSAGAVIIDGTIVSSTELLLPVAERRMGMVFQDFALFPHLNIEQNIGFGLIGQTNQFRQERVLLLANLLELEALLTKYPSQLSGGQQQRVALARALAPSPDALLLDEPFSSLDLELREHLVRQVRELIKDAGTTALVAGHNQLEAFAMADRVGVISAGKLLQWDSAFQLYHQPNCVYVADFVGEGVFLPGQVADRYSVTTALGKISGDTDHCRTKGENVKVLIRPDDILHDDNSPLQAKVLAKVFRGATFLYTLQLANGEQLLSLVPSHHDHPLNSPIGIRLEIDHLVVF